MGEQKRPLARAGALAALALLVALGGVGLAALQPRAMATAALPDRGEQGETPVAHAGGGYHLAAVGPPVRQGVSSGQGYTLTRIETRASPRGSQGAGYRLASFTAKEDTPNICVYLPLSTKRW